MRYLVLILRIFVLVAVVLAVFSFQDIKKVKAAPAGCTGTSAPFDCTINLASVPNDSIPANYEGNNITVSGTTINMNKIKIGTDGLACSEPNNSNCDSKRHFTNLTVENSGVVTHEILTRAEIESGGKTVNRTSGTGRWKKVDIEVTNKITLRLGGKIDVTGKGYPGAYFSWDGVNGVYEDHGCNGDTMGYLVGAGGISLRSDTTRRTNHGFGPGGGIAYNEYNGATGGGGSFGGQGKAGTGETIPLTALKTYNYLTGTHLDWGSGGGTGSHDGGGEDTACANGGAGGGIIDLKTNVLDMSAAGGGYNPSRWILADGAQGYMFQDDGNSAGSGGGSGGVIRLGANQILNNFQSGAERGVDVNVSSGTNYYLLTTYLDPTNPSNGKIMDLPSPSPKQMSARGGNRSDHNLPAVGAGGGGGWIVFGPGTTPPTLTATLSADHYSGLTPLTTTFTAAAGGTASGHDSTLNYTFWWNCDHPETTTYATTVTACGVPTTASVGAKFDNLRADQNPITTMYTYTTGTYHPKLIIERDSLAVQAMTTPITVTSPVPVIQSKKIEVTVSWKEGTVTKTVKLYDVLRSVVVP